MPHAQCMMHLVHKTIVEGPSFHKTGSYMIMNEMSNINSV